MPANACKFSALFLVCSLFICIPLDSSAAQSNPKFQQLIQTYVDAVEANDPVGIHAAWMDLNNNQNAVDDLRLGRPQLYYLYQVRGLYLRLQDLQSKRPNFFDRDQKSSATLDEIMETFSNDLSPQATKEAAESLLSLPAMKRVRGNDSLSEQASQELPEAPTPQGSALSQTHAADIADVSVRGLLLDVTFKASNAEGQYFDIDLNDQTVAQSLRLGKGLEFLRLSLNSGINVLKISVNRRSRAKAVKNPLVNVVFQRTVKGDQNFLLPFKDDQPQALRIEALP